MLTDRSSGAISSPNKVDVERVTASNLSVQMSEVYTEQPAPQDP